MPNNDKRYNDKDIINQGADRNFEGFPMVEIVGYDSGANVLRRVNVDSSGKLNITASGSDGALLDGVNSAIKATVKDLTNSNPLTTAIVDANGDQITSFGGGTQYTEDVASAADPIGTALNLIRKDTLAALTSADGDNVAARGTDKGELYVKHVDSLPVTGTFYQATQPVSGTVTANAGTNLNTSLLALEAGGNLASIKAKTDNIPAQGQALAAASTPVVLTAAQITTLTPPAAITGFATSAKQDTLLTELQLKADLTETQPVSLASVPSHAVTNAGTFAVQAALNAGTNNIGDVDVLTLPVAFNTGTRSATTQRVTIATDDSVPVTGTFWQATQPVSGTVTTTPPSNASTNIAQINAVAPLMGNGVTGTGSQRVTIASDNTVIPIANPSNLDVALSTRLKPADTLTAVTTVGTVTTITNTVPTSEVAPTTVLNGKTTVTTAGTRVVLAGSTTVKSVTIKALAGNTGTIYVGSATVAAANGFQLAAGDTISIDLANLNTINIDSSVNGEGVSYLGIN